MSRCVAKTPPFKAELASRASKSPQTNPAFRGRVNGKGFLILRVLAILACCVNFFLINVVIHEIGHYTAADYYELEPRIAFEFENITESGLSFNSIPIAHTSFIDNGNEEQVRFIALGGPVANLIFGLILFIVFLFSKNEILNGAAGIGMAASFLAFISNIIPFNGSDGWFIFGMG